MECKNCNNTFDASLNYCPHCGAKHIKNRLTPAVLITQVNEQFLSIDNTFLKTFIALFKQPQVVINGYINGTRKKYIDVLQYFAIALTLVGIQVFLMNTFFLSELENSFETLKSLESSDQSNNPFKSFEDINRYQSLIYILSIPLYAVASWLANLIIKPKLRYNFTEHLVINIYYYSQTIIITALLSILFLCFGLDYLIISGVVSILIFIYLFYTFKCVFQLDFWHAVAYFCLVMVIFGVVGFILGVLIVAMSIFIK